MEGLSLRVIARKFGVSKESVRKWILKFEQLLQKKLARKKEREAVLLMKRKVKRNGRIAYVSTCLDLARREVIFIQCTRSISSLSTINVMEEASSILQEPAPRNHGPCSVVSVCLLISQLGWLQKTFGIRNYIERWYRTFKERTRRFYNNFPVRNKEKVIERISGFLHLFAYWYNHMGPHETLKGRVPSSLS